jgi:Tfp pilus assembly protein PilF
MPSCRRLPLFVGLVAAATTVATGGCRVLHRKSSDQAIASARQLSLQGIDAQQRGDWPRAEALFAASIAACPSDERAQCGYAEALWRRGARDEALRHMHEAVRLSGKDPERLVQLGELYLAKGNLADAAAEASGALAINPALASAWALRGKVLEAERKPVEALASYHRALSHERQMPEVQFAVAKLYRQQNRPQRALATLQALAGSLPPGDTPAAAYVEQGAALAALGRHHDAAAALQQAVKAGNVTSDVMLQLAREQYLSGDRAAAQRSLAAVFEREPRSAPGLALARELDQAQATLATATLPLER